MAEIKLYKPSGLIVHVDDSEKDARIASDGLIEGDPMTSGERDRRHAVNHAKHAALYDDRLTRRGLTPGEDGVKTGREIVDERIARRGGGGQ